MTARIEPPEPKHRDSCIGYANRRGSGMTASEFMETLARSTWAAETKLPDPPPHHVGDLRRCKHGIVQICHWRERRRGSGWVSCRHHWDYEWRDISKFWERKLYRRAVEALEAEEVK